MIFACGEWILLRSDIRLRRVIYASRVLGANIIITTQDWWSDHVRKHFTEQSQRICQANCFSLPGYQVEFQRGRIGQPTPSRWYFNWRKHPRSSICPGQGKILYLSWKLRRKSVTKRNIGWNCCLKPDIFPNPYIERCKISVVPSGEC